MNIDIKKMIEDKSPGFFRVMPGFLSSLLIKTLERVNHIEDIRGFFQQNEDKQNLQFIEAVFEFLDFQYKVSDEDIARIPASGRLICVANHRLGVLDGLSLLKIIGSVRKDVKIVVNDILIPLDNMKDLFLFYDLYSSVARRDNIQKIKTALIEENAVIFFPSASVAKMSLRGIREGTWFNGPVFFAHKYGVPILPVNINGRNSAMYYLVSLLSHELSSLFLPQAMFSLRSCSVDVKIGPLLTKEMFGNRGAGIADRTALLREHVLSLGG
ncbi:MAG: 1-acyl-sn-glycerol-3-phosphate acyltransferase [Nitrospira sp.]|nr:1-acyl-sn-glycerol-3-phosphate acyltransferase [bacterium]MBL7049647.1 1-acyl-sn-glycerol-3-phosphate acyltransferase [Nitrospira sp.]